MCVVFLVGSTHTARAAGVVGTGTTDSCTDAALSAALAGGGLVTFNCGGPATIDISTGTGTKTISAAATIDGGGLITISGGNSVQVFNVKSGAHFALENLTIADGLGAGSRIGHVGGGIFNSGTLSVSNSTFTGNSDGVANLGSATIINSTFRGNTGGDIFNGTILTITNSAFIGNRRAVGAGILNFRALNVASSSFINNVADYTGGGIVSESTLTVTNGTFVGNSAVEGGAAVDNGGMLVLTSRPGDPDHRTGARERSWRCAPLRDQSR